MKNPRAASATATLGARIVPFALVLAAVGGGGGLAASEKARTGPAIQAGAARANRIQQVQAQARSARAPGGSPDADSKALLSQLTKRHTTSLQSENARATARFGVAKPAIGRIAPGGGAGIASGESASAQGQKGIAPDPCGGAFSLKAIAASPPLEPGEAVVLEGCGFGPYPPGGEIRLVGDFPGGFLKLQLSGWTPTSILAYVPMVTKVKDDPGAKIQVFRQDGKFTNWLDVGFRASREVLRLRPSDVSVACGIPQAQQDCTLASSHPLSESSFFGGATFAGKHTISWTYPLDCDDAVNKLKGSESESTDRATVGLRNGWLLAGYAWWWSEGGVGYVLPPEGFAPDVASATVAMKWGVFTNYCQGPRNSTARYRVDLYAVGPKGVPYR